MEPTHRYPAPHINASIAWWDRASAAVCSGQTGSFYTEQAAAVVSGGSNYDEARDGGAVNNHRCYCNTQKIRYHHVQHDFLVGSTLFPMINKMFAIKHALHHHSTPYGSWVMWVDRDVFFIDSRVSIMDVINRARAQRQTPSDCNILVSGDTLNAGVVLFRKTCWTMRLLDQWFDRIHKPNCIKPPWFDNTPMVFAVLAMLGYEKEHPNGITLNGERQNVLQPNCNRWTQEKTRSFKWRNDASAYINNRSAVAGSRVCISRGKGLNPGAGYQHVHFAGKSTHLSLDRCNKEASEVWKASNSTSTEVCQALGLGLDAPQVPPCLKKVAQQEVDPLCEEHRKVHCFGDACAYLYDVGKPCNKTSTVKK